MKTLPKLVFLFVLMGLTDYVHPASALPPSAEWTTIYTFGGDTQYNLCLDVQQNSYGYQVLSDTCNSYASQQFWINSTGSQADNVTITQAIGTNEYYMTYIHSGSQAGYVYMALPDNNGQPGLDQQWLLDGGTLSPYYGGVACMDVYGNNPRSGTAIDIYSCNNQVNQLFWTGLATNENTFHLIEFADGLTCLTEVKGTLCNPRFSCYYYTVETCDPTNQNQRFALTNGRQIYNEYTGHFLTYNSSNGAIEGDSAGGGSFHQTWWASPGDVYDQDEFAAIFHNIDYTGCLEYSSTYSALVFDSTCAGGSAEDWQATFQHK